MRSWRRKSQTRISTGKDIIYSPVPFFVDSYDVVGAKVFDTTRDNQGINTRLLKPGEGRVKLHQGTVLGYVKYVAQVHETLPTSAVRNVTERKQAGKQEKRPQWRN